MKDEDLYYQATKEVEGENRSPSLWAKVMALTEGDEVKAKYKYIKLRVEQLANNQDDYRHEPNSNKPDNFDLEFMPVSQFSKLKLIPEDKVIKMIRDGFYTGKIKDKTWYISREEIGNSKQNSIKPISKHKINRYFKDEYIPVKEFAEFKGMSSEKIVKMIKDGFYTGRIKDDIWYIHRDELRNLNQAPQISDKKNASNFLLKDEFIPVEDFAKFKSTTAVNVISMIKDGHYRGKVIDGKWYISQSEISDRETTILSDKIGFKWWIIWGWCSLATTIIYSLILLDYLNTSNNDELVLSIIFAVIVLNIILLIMVLKFNKYAFLIATVLSLSPILWGINGIYLKNRWNHPKVNK